MNSEQRLIGFAIIAVVMLAIAGGYYKFVTSSASYQEKACPQTVKVKAIVAVRSPSYTAVQFDDDHYQILSSETVEVGTLFCKKGNDYEKQ